MLIVTAQAQSRLNVKMAQSLGDSMATYSTDDDAAQASNAG